ncbi:MAG: NAD(P)/FAD-dependent oxidoreductase [Myxococcota bacterium]
MTRDVLIVGAGPAGISTALFLLARAPWLAGRLEVVDRAIFPRDKPCAGAVGARADKLLASIGVRVDVPGVTVEGLRLDFSAGAVQRRVGPIGRVVRRLDFDAELVRVARARGVPVTEGVRVTHVSRDAQGVTVETTAGVRRAAVLIGADGVGSVVRRSLGFPRGALHAQAVEVDTDVTHADDAALLSFDFRAQDLVGYGWDFPTLVNGRLMMSRGVYDVDWDVHPRVDVAGRLTRHLEARGLPADASRFKRYSVRGLELHRPMSAPRVLLVGEAAGVDPLLGEGIAQGVAYGDIAARYLVERLEDGRFDFEDWRPFFSRTPTALDLMVRSAALPFLRHAPLRRAFEDVTLAAPEALDVTTSIFAGVTPPARSAVSAFSRISARALALAPREVTAALKRRFTDGANA